MTEEVKPLVSDLLTAPFADMLPDFHSTAEIPSLEGMIGQKRAVKAVEFGLDIKQPGYNIFVAGPPGTGKITYIREAVKKKAAKENTPGDWIYVHNFKNPDRPVAINLPAGKGQEFCKQMDELIDEIQEEIRKTFSGDEYERQRNEVLKGYKEKQQEISNEIDRKAREKGFIIQRKPTGLMTVPQRDGQPLKQEEFNQLSPEEREEIGQKSREVQEMISDALRQIRQLEREGKEALEELDARIAHHAIDGPIDDVKQKYEDNDKLKGYLEAVKENIIKNIDDFKDKEEETSPLPFMAPQRQEDPKMKYRVNLFIDNHNLKGAPVVIESNPTYSNLTGKVEYQNRMGAMVTDYTFIKPGSLHRANGGYLVINARDMFGHAQAWEALKRALKNKSVVIENIGEYLGFLTISTLKPEPIPLKVKVLLIGDPFVYQILHQYDEDFAKLFKIKADFDTVMEATAENVSKLANFISSHCNGQDLLHFSRDGVIAVAEYSARIAGQKEKLSTRFNELVEIIYEAVAMAEKESSELVGRQHVHEAIEEKIYRSNKIEEKIHHMLEEDKILLDLEGEKIGQINGLTVSDLGDYRFGQAVKITAATYLGRKGIINIEREVKMSGRIHSKGVLIISGYLGSKFAIRSPLSITASLTFEQNYQGVDGDSASVAELVAILSDLAQVPIKQNISVTGSVNQKGDVQPVGGITEKVEGFYKACKIKGIEGAVGVIIPQQNINNLLLSDEVKNAVKEGKLLIYPIKNVTEGIEVLTGLKAGERDEVGNYPQGTLNYLVEKKLTSMAEYMKKENQEEKAKDNEMN